ncbi:MAG: acyltransferase [Asticcacaulis sp.]|nr:acyltransferase [Asticcacaulis sp.]
MIDLSKLQRFGFPATTFLLPELEKQNIECGTLYLSETAKKKPPRITHSDNAAKNTIIVCCPLDAPIMLQGSDNLVVIIGASSKQARMGLNFWGDNAIFAIGQGTTVGGLEAEFRNDDALIIGADCMISKGVTFRPNDMHPVFDETDRQINKSAPIVVRDHVWIGQSVMVLKGKTIEAGAVIGAGSVITKDVPQACAVGGNPAKIVRERIYWTRDRIPTYSERQEAKSYIQPVIGVAATGR